MAYPEPLERLVQAFERLPGIGRRSAERLAFHLLRDPRARELAQAIEYACANARTCRVCCNASDVDPCRLCSSAERDASTILVVEEPRDVEAVEKSRVFKGAYHVLCGSWNPVEGIEARALTLGRLVERVKQGGVREVILGTDPDAEGEATALLVLEALEAAEASVLLTRLARGLPAGSALEYLHKGVLEDALVGRVELTRLRRAEKDSAAPPGGPGRVPRSR